MKYKNIKGSESKQRTLRWPSLDLFSFSASSNEYTSYSSYVGVICSIISISILLLYIIVTSRDFIQQPPGLVKLGSTALPTTPNQLVYTPPPVGLEISYWKEDGVSGNWTHSKVDFTNTDPYFRYKFIAKSFQISGSTFPKTAVDVPGVACTSTSGWGTTTTGTNTHVESSTLVCPNEEIREEQTIQGSYGLPLYEYFEVEVAKCNVDKDEGCASTEEIDALIELGDVMVIIFTKEEVFDPIMYHNNERGGYSSNSPYSKLKRGVYEDVQSKKIYALPGREQLIDVFMEGRSIKFDQPLLGSLQKSKFDIMTFSTMETATKRNGGNKNKVMNFYYRLHTRKSEEEVQYRIKSILELFAYWGAMASFITIFTFGVLARSYNKWKFESILTKEEYRTSKASKKKPKQAENYLFADSRLLNKGDFDRIGRRKLSIEELNFPSTPYGEIRAIALIEHLRKQNAAQKIGAWYRKESYRCKFDKKKNLHRKFPSTSVMNAQSNSNDSIPAGDEITANSTPVSNQQSAGALPSSSQSLASQRSGVLAFPLSIASAENDSISDLSSKKNKETPTISTKSTAVTGNYNFVSQTPRNMESIKDSIIENSVLLVKKAAHNRQLRPWTELTEFMPNDTVMSLFKSYTPIASTPRLIRWKLNGNEVVKWLGMKEQYIHPVNFEGKVTCVPGQKPSIYSWAKYETCEAKYDKKSRMLALRFQTYLSGTGIPDENGNPQFTY